MISKYFNYMLGLSILHCESTNSKWYYYGKFDMPDRQDIPNSELSEKFVGSLSEISMGDLVTYLLAMSALYRLSSWVYTWL